MKRFRLWLNKDGKPMVIEVLGQDITPELASQLTTEIETVMSSGKLMIVGPEWEVRSI